MLKTLEGIEKVGVGDKQKVEDRHQAGAVAENGIPEQVVCRGRRREAGTGKEGVGSGD